MADTENGSANTKLPESSLAKKETTLRDIPNGSQAPNPKETVAVKVNGLKRPFPESNLSSTNHQSLTNTAVNARLVYVRRKADSELSKNNTNNKPNFSQPKKVGEQNAKILEVAQMKDTRVCDSETAKPSAPNSQLKDEVCNTEAAKPSAPNFQHKISDLEAAKPSAPNSQLEDKICDSEAVKPSAPNFQHKVCDSEAAKPSASNFQLEVRDSEAAKPSASNFQLKVRNSEAEKPSASNFQHKVCDSEAAKLSAPTSQRKVSDTEAAKPPAPNFQHNVCNIEAAKPSEPNFQHKVGDSEAAKLSAPTFQHKICDSEAAKPLAPNFQHKIRDSEAVKPSAPQLEGKVCDPEATKPSAPISQLEDSDNRRDVVAATPAVLPKKTNELRWEERFCRLQNLLKILDQSVHDGYVKMLQSLNSVELSRLAVELEKRSISLSVQEVKEMQRVRQLDLLGRYNTEQQQNQKQEEEQRKPGDVKL